MVLPWAVVLAVAMFGQAKDPTCPADLPVDDLIAEIHKQQSKKTQRTRNPLPDDICIGGWCSRIKKPASDRRKPAPGAPEPETLPAGGDTSSESSSKTPEAKCDAAMEVALSAAHDVDVGDYYFARKNYRGALLRYNDALAKKAQDAAIRVRLGRVFERLEEVGRAKEHYEAALKLGSPAKWVEEAKSALARLPQER